MNTLLFCTSYADSEDAWNGRYKSWYDYYYKSRLNYQKMLMFDDGSPLMPSFCSPEIIYTFDTHLGKQSVVDYDGWYRSFGTAIRYAKNNGFDKIVHCEADAYILSTRMFDFVNSITTGWHCFWSPKHNMPESALQIICTDQIECCEQFTSKDYNEYRHKTIDCLFPYTDIHKFFVGDRYGEDSDMIAGNPDYSCQTSSNMINNWKQKQ